MKALLFPGQGAQAVGMGKDLASAHPECKALFDKAGQVLGYDLAKLCFEGPIEELTKSSVTQPAVFVVSLEDGRSLEEASRSQVCCHGRAQPWRVVGSLCRWSCCV